MQRKANISHDEDMHADCARMSDDCALLWSPLFCLQELHAGLAVLIVEAWGKGWQVQVQRPICSLRCAWQGPGSLSFHHDAVLDTSQV